MSIERIFYPAATMAAGSVSYLGGVKELQFRVMNLMRISLKRTRFWCCACARRWILARAGLDFGTEARAQAAASAPLHCPTRRREHTIPSGFTVGPRPRNPSFVCHEWSWDRFCVRAAPGPNCSCRARTARFQSVLFSSPCACTWRASYGPIRIAGTGTAILVAPAA